MLTSTFLGLALSSPLPDHFFNLDRKYGTIYFGGWVAEIAFSPEEKTPNLPILTPVVGARNIPGRAKKVKNRNYLPEKVVSLRPINV